MDDVVPGLVSDKLPNPRQSGGNIGAQINLLVMPKTNLYIHGL